MALARRGMIVRRTRDGLGRISLWTCDFLGSSRKIASACFVKYAKVCGVKAISEMGEDPLESACGSRFQTTTSCKDKEP
jgi:hypothetical protein